MAETSVELAGDEPLTEPEYDELIAGASTYRKRLLVRLGGEVGLRATEMVAVRPEGIARAGSDPDRFVLSVSESNGGSRTAYLPPAVERELGRYANSNGIDERDRVIDVTPRRVQMLIREVGDRLATETGNRRFETVSAHDLRGYFARTLLRERGVSPRVVQAIGGWRSLEALDPYLDAPSTDEIIAALEPEGRTGRSTSLPLDAALIDTSTREELEREVCGALAERYRFAWIDASSLGGERSANAASGIDAAAIRSLRDELEGDSETRIDAGVVHTSAISYGETEYGTLYVGAGSSLRDGEHNQLSTLGRRIGHAITAIRRRKLLLADTIFELEFRSTDTGSAFIAASDRFDCRLGLESIVSASDSALLYYVTLSGSRAPDVLEYVSEHRGIEDCRLVEGRDSGALLEFVISGGCPLSLLMDYGATINEMSVVEGDARILADCAYDTDLRALVDRMTDAFPDTRLVGKQATERGARTVEGFAWGATDRLTDRQQAALRAAYFGGYFDWPRGSTAEEIADAMGVSSPTLHSHLRKGQRELLELLFEDR